MLLFTAPLPFRQSAARVTGRRQMQGAQGRHEGRSRPWQGARVCPHGECEGKRDIVEHWAAHPWFSQTFSILHSPFSRVAPSFYQYICLAQNIGYGTIKLMTNIFILSLAGVQQDRNSGLSHNYGATICEKWVQ